MKVAVLGSGSAGNSTLVEVGETRVLVDAGFSGKDLERRLAVLGLEPSDITAIVVTHDHQDHTRGAGVFARRHGTPVYITDATRAACDRIFRGGETTHAYRVGRTFEIGPVRVEPFLTVHDAVDPVAVSLVDVETEARVGVATDLGRPTAQVLHALSGSDFLILEANHDDTLLRLGPYPWSVKQRIASSHGHLSNHAAARFACELVHPRLAGILLAHLSGECNRPELAQSVVGEALERAGYRGYLAVAPQEEPTELLDIEELRRRTGPEQLTFI
ncbi:MAG: MBL fold metallo-hydrolase [Gemmatimonadetes bacterium]|nr:MBL fold metallo-hydrolase [Gemmatimonadota bacterium]